MLKGSGSESENGYTVYTYLNRSLRPPRNRDSHSSLCNDGSRDGDDESATAPAVLADTCGVALCGECFCSEF